MIELLLMWELKLQLMMMALQSIDIGQQTQNYSMIAIGE